MPLPAHFATWLPLRPALCPQALGRQLGRTLKPRSGSLLAGAHFLLALLFPASGVLLALAPWVS